jgi:hypothetical protein
MDRGGKEFPTLGAKMTKLFGQHSVTPNSFVAVMSAVAVTLAERNVA